MPTPDDFKSHARELDSPLTRAALVTPDDAADLPFVSRAINVAETGLVSVVMQDGSQVVLSVASGGLLPVRVVRVLATGTTATGVVILA